MSIAEQIMLGTQQQSKNWSALSNTLASLGQQIGQTLETNEYRKQAQAVLPALQQTYATAMDKIQAGNVTEGYRDILNAQLQFGSSQNPFIANMNQMAGSIAEQAANNYLKMKQYEIQYGRTGTSGTGTAAGLPATQVDVGQFFPNVKLPSNVNVGGQDIGQGGGQGGGMDMTQGTPEQRAAQSAADAEYGTYDQIDQAVTAELPKDAEPTGAPEITRDQVLNNLAPKEKKEFESAPKLKQDSIIAGVNFDLQPTERKKTIASTLGVTVDTIPENTEIWSDPRLGKYFDGAVGFAKPIKQEELRGTGISFSTRGGMNVQTAREVTNQDVINVWEGTKDKPGTKTTVKSALDTMDDANMKKLFKDFNNNIFDLRENTRSEGDVFYVNVNGEDKEINKTQRDAIVFLSNLPITSQSEFTPLVYSKKAEAPAAPAAGGARPSLIDIKNMGQEGAPAPTQPTAAPQAPPRELSLAEQITATATAPTTTAAPAAQRKQPERRGATAAQASTRLTRERDELRKALYEVTRRGEMRGLRKGLDPNNPTVKRGIERLKEIEKELASL